MLDDAIRLESAPDQYVSKLVSGVDVVDLDLCFKISTLSRPIDRNSVRSGYMSDLWTSAFDNHLDDWFIVFTNGKATHCGERSGAFRVMQ